MAKRVVIGVGAGLLGDTSGIALHSMLGAWGSFATSFFRDWVSGLRDAEVELKGDAEHALLALLRAVKEECQKSGREVSVKPTNPGDHQGIGGAEKQHDGGTVALC